MKVYGNLNFTVEWGEGWGLAPMMQNVSTVLTKIVAYVDVLSGTLRIPPPPPPPPPCMTSQKNILVVGYETTYNPVI